MTDRREPDANRNPFRSASSMTATSDAPKVVAYLYTRPGQEKVETAYGRFFPEVVKSGGWTETPLFAHPPQPGALAKGDVKITNWLKVAKLAGEHGIRYRTNRALEEFLTALQSHTTPNTEADRLREALTKCRDQFQFYANEHTAAGKLEKAATNQRFSDLASSAIGPA